MYLKLSNVLKVMDSKKYIWNLTRQYVWNLIHVLIRCYIFLLDKLIVILPNKIYIQSYDYRTIDLDYSIHEYWIKYNKKYYKVSTIDTIDTIDATKYLMYNKDKRNIINHCAILDRDGNYVKDITEMIRSFLQYDGLIKWIYILIHIDVNMSDKLLLCMNDLNMSEKILECGDLVNLSFNLK